MDRLNGTISLKDGYTISFFGEVLVIRVDTENGTLEFYGRDGDLVISSEPFDSEPWTAPLSQMIASTREFFKDWGVDETVADAIIERLTPWFEKYAIEEPTEDPWEKVLKERVEELQQKEETHRATISKRVEEFRKWVAEADETSIYYDAEDRAKVITEVRCTYKAVWKRYKEAEAELARYREAMSH